MHYRQLLPFLLSGFLLLSPSIFAAEKILRYTDHEPYGGMRTQIIKEIFFAEIEKESQGRLKIEPHWNGETAISYDALTTISDGSKADMGETRNNRLTPAAVKTEDHPNNQCHQDAGHKT